MTAPYSLGALKRGGGDTLALPPRGRFLAILLLVPGGLLLLAAVLLAVPGVALLAAALSRLSAASPARVPVLEREREQGDSRQPLAAGTLPLQPTGAGAATRARSSTGCVVAPARHEVTH